MNAADVGHIQDFTTAQYPELLRLAKSNYKFIGYREIAAEERFVLWRHDCDYSLNRSLRLAQIESQASVKATYFLNPHSEYYNPIEKGQAEIVAKIIAHGHDIGLHFDSAYYDIQSEDELDELVAREAGWLKNWFGFEPAAFSFHNPNDFLLSCERDTYGGLINSYSRTFKTNIPYCSDSNGYWRFKRLRDVLESAEAPRLQVLTHPEWWQEKPLHPRERIFRCVYGRAKETMSLYDAAIDAHGRKNLAGPAGSLKFLKEIDSAQFELCDYLWNGRRLQSLFIELHRLHQRQIKQLCKVILHKKRQVSPCEADAFLNGDECSTDSWRLFLLVLDVSPGDASGYSEGTRNEWQAVLDQLTHGGVNISDGKLEEGCIYLCGAMEGLAKWGRAHEVFRCDGFSNASQVPD